MPPSEADALHQSDGSKDRPTAELGDEFRQEPGEQRKRRWSFRLLVASLLSIAVWGFLAFRLMQTEPQLLVRVLFALMTLALMVLAIRQCFIIGRTSLRVLVVGGPLLIAILSLPVRQVVSHWQLRQQLTLAGVTDFTLGCNGRFKSWMRAAATAIIGETGGQRFNTDLTALRIQLELAELDHVTKLPAQHLSLVTIRRAEEPAAAIDADLVSWLNTIPGEPLVSLRIASPKNNELKALRDLRQLTMLKMSKLAMRDLELDFPAVFDLEIRDSTLDAPFEARHVSLPNLERFTIDGSTFQITPELFDCLSRTKRVTFRDCEFSQATFESVFQLPSTELTINHMMFPQNLRLPTGEQVLGRSLTTWESDVQPSQLIDLLQKRQSRAAQIRLKSPFSIEEFNRLLSLPRLRFVRIQSPWLTKTHLLGLTEMTRPFRLSVLDSAILEQDALWLQEHKASEVVLYLQSTLAE